MSDQVAMTFEDMRIGGIYVADDGVPFWRVSAGSEVFNMDPATEVLHVSGTGDVWPTVARRDMFPATLVVENRE